MFKKHKTERKERTTLVLGIFTASVIGFVVNLYANIYFEVFLTGRETMVAYNQLALIIPTLILVLAIAFLSFLVYDYQHELTLNRPFLKRFFEYYENVFWLSRATRKVSRVIVFLVKWIFAILFSLALFETSGVIASSIWIFLIFIWVTAKYLYLKQTNAKTQTYQ